jgi:hypothetical protein
LRKAQVEGRRWEALWAETGSVEVEMSVKEDVQAVFGIRKHLERRVARRRRRRRREKERRW